MKLYKLITHQKNFNAEDLVLNPKDHPDAKIGDVVEIYLPEDEGVRLLLQITCFQEDKKGTRDVISIDASIAQAFNLPIYSEVVMQVIDPATVALDSVEITFKDQYMGRSEMWRLKTYLTNTCVYTNKKILYCTESIRCQVYELWSQGDRVACGVITEDTKVVFRSSTSMVYLFIQMSSEMWDFDIHGDLYFEKAVNGFLTDLFMKWKKIGSNHEVTIVLFSRTFYSAKSLDEFPSSMRECLQMDYKGRYYEDFYRVAIQNERNDDWSSILVQLRRLFTAYQSIVLRYHERSGVIVPPATNSTAAQGNFLEVLNISLNVFEKHYLDRSFDRTGQLSVVITPGVGVFEVDRELTNITKQRIIDNGVGSDLVCVGEQPLHAVPLLKFHNKDSSMDAIDDYSMPHWINLSFYSTNKKVAYSSFIPRIKLPPLCPRSNAETNKENQKHKFNADPHQSEYIYNSLFDYDAYDAQIFTLPSAHGTCSLQRNPRTKKTSVPGLDMYGSVNSPHDLKSIATPMQLLRRKMSDPDIHCGTNVLTDMARFNRLNTSESMTTIERQPQHSSPLNQKNNATLRPGRALINPFAPSHVTIKLTSNRRRWTHIFPKGPTGVLIQQHHYQAVPMNSLSLVNKNVDDMETSEYGHVSMSKSMNQSFTGSICSLSSIAEYKRKTSTLHSPAGPTVTVEPSKTLTLLWGATGEQEWTPALTTGVDWKSLTIPACLPITTDYFPDQRSLHNDYVVSDYTLLPDSVNAEYALSRAIYRKPLTTEEVFRELISQRLAQGFQLIVMPDTNEASPQPPGCGAYAYSSRPNSGIGNVSSHNLKLGPSAISKPKPRISIVQTAIAEPTKEFLLSIGRIFHKISLTDAAITVTRYRPRHPYQPINVDYRYRFQAPQHSTYEVSGVNFTTEKLENYNWNFMDHYICTRGDTDYPLQESFKYWRYRMYLMPKEHPATKKIMESPQQISCDIYSENAIENTKQQIDDFMRFVEAHLNKIRKIHYQRSTRLLLQGSPTVQQSHLTRRRHSTSILARPPQQVLGNSPFRERLGSNRLPAMRPRSGSKIIDRSGKILQGTEATTLSLTPEPSLLVTTEDNEESVISETKLSQAAPLTEIFEALRHPSTGVSFLAKAQSLPSCTFVSYDAINWLNRHIEGICNPIEILERMRKEGMICHASGEISKPIVPGYYLYYIVLQDKKSKDYAKPLCDFVAFENEWMEIELKPETIPNPVETNIPRFLHESLELNFLEGPVYKQLHLEIDPTQKSDRVEWGHARYHSTMTPGYAFELVVQWVTASGPIVYDLIYGWCRKAQQCSFHLVPIPADLLAEPFTEKSDPLRGPIFIPLNTSCLEKDGNILFKEFQKETWPDRLHLFQEAIVIRFGFMPCYVETKIGSNEASFDRQYVHCTGNMFVLVPSPHQGLKIRRRLASGDKLKKPTFIKRYPLNNVYTESQGTAHDTYVTRHVNLLQTDDFNVSRKTGFLWSWNHMISNKKWKSQVLNCSSDGELFQLRMLEDFKHFCSNQNDRLVNFWDECWAKKEAASLKTSE